jgi:hypothetical protein
MKIALRNKADYYRLVSIIGNYFYRLLSKANVAAVVAEGVISVLM